MLNKSLVLWMLLSFGAFSSKADKVVLNAGRIIDGTVIQTNESSVLVQTEAGALSYSKFIIKSIELASVEAEPPNSRRISSLERALALFGKQPWAKNVKQVPATVIEKGILRHIPYFSFRSENGYELNVY